MVNIVGSTISHNTAAINGGGLALESVAIDGSTTVANIALSTIGDNTAAGQGGGIFVNFSGSAQLSYTLALTHVTVAYNGAHSGGGIYLQTGAVTLQDTLLAQNTRGANIAAALGAASGFSSLGHNLSDDLSTAFLLPRLADKINTPAGLPNNLALHGGQTATFLPSTGSAVLGGGDNLAAFPLDQIGHLWLKPWSDIGAY